MFTLERGLSDSLSIAAQFHPAPMAGRHAGRISDGHRPWSLWCWVLLGVNAGSVRHGPHESRLDGGLSMVIFLEKVTRYGPALSKVVGGVFIVLGVGILLHPVLLQHLSV